MPSAESIGKAPYPISSLPFVAFNQGSICHLETVGTMHFVLNWKKPWQIPAIIKETSERKKEMEHMGAAYTDDMLPDVLSRFENVFQNVAVPGS